MNRKHIEELRKVIDSMYPEKYLKSVANEKTKTITIYSLTDLDYIPPKLGGAMIKVINTTNTLERHQ